MSYPGMIDPGMSSESARMRAMQEAQRRAQLAQALQQGMDAQAPQTQQPNMNAAYGGASTAGSDILKALNYSKLQNANDPLAPIKVTPQQVGGGASAWTQRNLPGLASLFGLGG